MNPLFADLEPSTLCSIEDELSNNETSSNEELIDFFIEELELKSEQAEAAVELRTEYRMNIYRPGEGPLHMADGATFNPHTKCFS